MKLDVNEMCFACGKNNPIGLKLNFRFEGEEYITEFEVRPEHQGWRGIVHGGLLATVLDEVMARMLWEKNLSAITGRLNIRYLKPVSVGEKLHLRGRLTKHRSPLIETSAEAVNEEGVVVAEATAVSMEV